MTMADDRPHAAPEAGACAHRIREEMARRRISRQTLADQARISMSTLEKGLSGRRPFTLSTMIRLETALGLTLRQPDPATDALDRASTTAPDELGNYSRASVSWLEGSYLTIRPSFGERGAVYAYRTDIHWDPEGTRLAFREAERADRDFTQFGSVAVPNQSGHIYLVTNRHGQHRLIVVARPTITGEMHGLLTTLLAGRGSHLSPVSTPIVLVRAAPGDTMVFGRVGPDNPAYAGYREALHRTIDDQFAALIVD